LEGADDMGVPTEKKHATVGRAGCGITFDQQEEE
jgi:hypothetical protein